MSSRFGVLEEISQAGSTHFSRGFNRVSLLDQNSKIQLGKDEQGNRWKWRNKQEEYGWCSGLEIFTFGNWDVCNTIMFLHCTMYKWVMLHTSGILAFVIWNFLEIHKFVCKLYNSYKENIIWNFVHIDLNLYIMCLSFFEKMLSLFNQLVHTQRFYAYTHSSCDLLSTDLHTREGNPRLFPKYTGTRLVYLDMMII